jgi:hypothetical protein
MKFLFGNFPKSSSFKDRKGYKEMKFNMEFGEDKRILYVIKA